MNAIDQHPELSTAAPAGADARVPVIVAHWQALWAAVQFLTRLPVPATFLAADDDRPRLQLATVYIPLVGTMIGLATAGAIWATSHIWPIWLAVLVGLVGEALVTGALHEDALADCCDALGGGWTRADVLMILDDSRLGTYGVLGLTLAVLMRAGALASFPEGMLLAAVLASATLGRWVMILAMTLVSPVPERPSLARQAGRQTLGHVFGGALLAVPGMLPLAFLSPTRLGLSIAVVVALTASFVFYLRRRIGGITGDGVGATCYLSQIAVLLCCAG